MKVNSIGLNYTHSNQFLTNRPYGSGDFLFLHFKTSAIVVLDGVKLCAEKDSFLIYSKGTPQLYSAHIGSYTNDFIHFDAEGEWDIQTIPLDTLLVLPSTKQINKIIKDMYLEFISNNSNRNESLNLLLKLLFIKINELVNYKPKDTRLCSYYDALLNLRSRIYRHPEDKWSIETLAGQVNLSTSHFQRLYKKTFGITCIADVITSKIQFAKTSLTATSDTVREIASLCGYENEEHFMRQFKQIVGITPSEYRKTISN